METGPLAVWLWNELVTRSLPIVCPDARHASAALSMMPHKTDRHDAAGLAQIVRALMSARDVLVGIRGKIENEIRGPLKTFGVMFGAKVGGLARRAEEIITGELTAAPKIGRIVEALIEARHSIIERIKTSARQPSRTPWPACS
ncbi:hypothetical protein [Mesorhizobium sp.]|uniref:hypothetical protein n=1 Tax=Mesorhizobium sp. TaxID=1871066 RepID=UPI0025D6E6F2|nr:hypothetical protein [Mesorhizobium sp.]